MVYKLEDVKPAGYSFDITTAGLYILPVALVVLVASYPLGILNSKFGVKPFLLFGSVIGAFGSIFLVTETVAIQIPEYVSIAALGFAMILVSRQILLVLSIKPTEMGAMTSINQVFFNVGQSLGPAISASILSTYASAVVLGGHAFTLPTVQAFQYIFLIVSAIFLLSFAVSLFGNEVIMRKERRNESIQVTSRGESDSKYHQNKSTGAYQDVIQTKDSDFSQQDSNRSLHHSLNRKSDPRKPLL